MKNIYWNEVKPGYSVICTKSYKSFTTKGQVYKMVDIWYSSCLCYHIITILDNRGFTDVYPCSWFDLNYECYCMSIGIK